ncbi:Uncharacterised protein [uncultured archaeon]|nr:Uncharacterised protein [uncultured archaeon]
MPKNKLFLLVGALIALVVLGGVIFYLVSNNTPAQKVERLEKKVNDAKETSGYNACVAKLDEREKAQKDCTTAKLAEAGYKDGVNCIEDYDKNPTLCKDTTRYNAEVNGGNECIPISNKITSLTLADCLKLLNDNQ